MRNNIQKKTVISVIVFLIPYLLFAEAVEKDSSSIFEPLPLVSYDTDNGFGYGGKAFFLNFLNLNESFDAVLFRSSKGLRWYRLVFSLPDFEKRQGKVYPISIDLQIDYTKYIAYSFYGIGNSARFDDEEKYTRITNLINLIASRGFTKSFVGQFGLNYFSGEISTANNGLLYGLLVAGNAKKVEYLSLSTVLRFDTRNSFINPSIGLVLQVESEWVPPFPINDIRFFKWSLWAQYYQQLFFEKLVFATRFGLQSIDGENLPLQVLLQMGGDANLRGSPQGRFVDNALAVFNAEFRFPIYGRLGGIAGWDAGKVWPSISRLGLNNWSSNPALGLRYYFDTFVVRADFGFGSESTGFYLNFGHLF